MKLRFVTTFFLLPLVVYADNYDTLLRRYEKQISQQSRQLKSLRARLAENERDVLKWQRRAEDSRQQWSSMADDAERARAKVEMTREDWIKTRHLADAAEWDAATQTLLSRAANQQLTQMVRELYARRRVASLTPLVTL